MIKTSISHGSQDPWHSRSLVPNVIEFARSASAVIRVSFAYAPSIYVNSSSRSTSPYSSGYKMVQTLRAHELETLSGICILLKNNMSFSLSNAYTIQIHDPDGISIFKFWTIEPLNIKCSSPCVKMIHVSPTMNSCDEPSAWCADCVLLKMFALRTLAENILPYS